jgi:NAD(P)-dependent dehydrogenase (short-subunit alcohol dehydrogenase family)
MEKKAFIVSLSSDIGLELAKSWSAQGIHVDGSYRNETDALSNYGESQGSRLMKCNLSSSADCEDAFLDYLNDSDSSWDYLVFATGTQEPVGNFDKVNFDDWSLSINVNAINQLRILHKLLPIRNLKDGRRPIVFFFAGAGSNSAPPHYSAYIASKIFLTKMTELLATEITDTTFVIVGPGWVKTKIHEATLYAGENLAGLNYNKTKDMLRSEACTDIASIIRTFDWIRFAPTDAVNGRNFSVAFDQIGSPELLAALQNEPEMYKLRRNGNSWKG